MICPLVEVAKLGEPAFPEEAITADMQTRHPGFETQSGVLAKYQFQEKIQIADLRKGHQGFEVQARFQTQHYGIAQQAVEYDTDSVQRC